MATFQPIINAAGSGSGPLSTDGWPAASPTTINETSPFSFISPDATEMANAWELPANAGTLTLPTGVTTKVPTSAAARKTVTNAITMFNLYAKFVSGQKLTATDQEAAAALGGDIATAARTGKGQAVNKALTEIVSSLHNTVGIAVQDFPTKAGKGAFNALMSSTVGTSFAATLQNSGYAVTKNMTVQQMLGETSGPKAQQPLGTMSQGMTVGQYVQGLGNLSKDQISQLQQSMFNAGLYDASYYNHAGTSATDTNTITQGVLDTGTILAFRKAMQVSLKSNTPLEQVIGGNLPVPGGTGSVAGFAGDISNSSLPGNASSTYVPQTTTAQLQEPLIKAFEAALGRAPSEQELSTFTTSYNQQQTNASKYATDHGQSPQTNVDLQTGVPYLLTAPTASASAAADAMNANPVEYQAHGVANAFGMLMNLVDRQGTSALNTPGRAPNVSS